MYCFVDVDIDQERQKHRTAAAFVHATDLRYGFTSNDLRQLGGSEKQRVEDFFVTDHEWKDKGPITLERKQMRLVVKLFPEKAPMACENFVRLCKGEEKDKMLNFVDCKFHRVVPGFICQTGDIIYGNGTGGSSVFASRKFKDEKGGLMLKHDKRGILSMGNSGKNSNTSQWFLTFGPAPNLNGKHVVFGELISGFDTLDQIEALGTEEGGEPSKLITVSKCGIWSPGLGPGAGFWFDVPDPESFHGFTPVFMVQPRVGVVSPSAGVFQKFQEFLGDRCIVVPVENVQEKGSSLLETFSLDLILVAPALGKELKVESSSNIFVAKPAQCLASVQTWAAEKEKQWPDFCCWDLIR